MDHSLSLKGYDIDFEKEIKMTLNENVIGFLSGTKEQNNKQLAEFSLEIEAANLIDGENTLIFENIGNPYMWGIKDILIQDFIQ